MGASQFTAIALGKSPHDAFDKARNEALYWHGHGGYTGTIAEKPGFKFAGKVDSWHWDKLHDYFEREVARKVGVVMSRGERLSGKLAPARLRPTIERFAEAYDDKWGPAICFQITGTKALEIKKGQGRDGSHDKVYIFVGWASS